jgi:hypothetical protein
VNLSSLKAPPKLLPLKAFGQLVTRLNLQTQLADTKGKFGIFSMITPKRHDGDFDAFWHTFLVNFVDFQSPNRSQLAENSDL